ncbi:MAG: hypothetical protein ABFD89_22645 [Bryobacteraceae bacterium]
MGSNALTQALTGNTNKEAETTDRPSGMTYGDNGDTVAGVIPSVAGIKVDVVWGGTLMQIEWGPGTDPEQVAAGLKALGVKVRDDFPARGAFGGKKDTQLARALVINARVSDSGKFIDIVAQNGEDLSIGVSKKKADDILGELKALNKIHAKNMEKLEKVMAERGNATIILSEAEQFGVNFWKTDDGKAFYDSATPEPPAKTEESE